MNQVKTYRDLEVWQISMTLAIAASDIADSLPARERFGLADQMRRAAISIPSNIAEGQARGSRLDFVRFLLYSRGSLAELETLLLIAQQRGYLTDVVLEPVWSKAQSAGKLLGALIRSLK